MELSILSLIFLVGILACLILLIKTYKVLQHAKKEFKSVVIAESTKLTDSIVLDFTNSLDKVKNTLDKKLSGMVNENLDHLSSNILEINTKVLANFEDELNAACTKTKNEIVDELKLKLVKADDEISAYKQDAIDDINERTAVIVEKIYSKYFKTVMTQRDHEKLLLTVLDSVKGKLK